jgi:2-polyprenyl-3-methyl-5-hydroxy-6-metoxy-1,4-benzoquinol methylase
MMLKIINTYRIFFLKKLFYLYYKRKKSIVLCSRLEINLSYLFLSLLFLKKHRDFTKNWDILLFLSNAVFHPKDVMVLDAGSGARSIILENLNLLGYINLHAIDLMPKMNSWFIKNNINFKNIKVEDYSRMSVDKFNLIYSLSVLEHVPDPYIHIKSLYNLLLPNGVIHFTTDYFPDFIDCSGIYPYGHDQPEMKIFNKNSINSLILSFIKEFNEADFHFEATSLKLRNTVVTWERVNRKYTFLFFSLNN